MAMNRRHFLGNALAAAAAPKFLDKPKVSPEVNKARPGAWVRGGLLDGGGMHEPYLFVVRRGGQSLDALETCRYQESENLIRKLHASGVEVFHTHLYKGFGMVAEREGMEATKRAVAFAHSLGMKADAYIQWNSMMYETFFAEEPGATQWIQRDVDGRPIALPYGYQQSYRYAPCFSNPEYLAYLKRVVRYAIEEVKTDFIHFDNFFLNSEPESCHCPQCVEGFREYLRTKYTEPQRRERFGFARIDFVNPPLWNRDNDPAQLEILSDPAFQEWVMFRCQVMSKALGQMYELTLSLNPQVALEINPKGITGENLAWESGIDHAQLLRYTRAFWSEEENTASFQADGRLISKIRSYKLARAYGNVLLAYVSDDPVSFAEGLAFNQTPSFVGTGPIAAAAQTYIDFYRAHRELYVDSIDLAAIGVFRSFPSIAYHNAGAQLSAVLAEQLLIQAQVPFDLLFDADLQNLDGRKAVLLPDTECLSDAQIASLRAFVEQGGSLLIIGNTAVFDAWRRLRPVSGLLGLLDVSASQLKLAGPLSKSLGRGRVGYLPSFVWDGAMPAARPYFAIRNEFWKRPRNSATFLELLAWVCPEKVVTAAVPEFVAVNVTEQAEARRRCVHLVNYAAGEGQRVPSATIRLELPAGGQAQSVRAYSPEWATQRDVAFGTDVGSVRVQAPEFGNYLVLAVCW